ncbi:hypothetical protein LP414_30750 [Polaromonas sp. P1(28)-13]|nr:hypothetical protein LP414_30750 [Polaromonas sp. P1(28)-13]
MFSPHPVDRALPDLANVWRAGELGSASLQTVDTGYAALNDVLPGGGWPQGVLIELLQPQAGLHEWGLIAPALAAAQQAAAPNPLMVLVGAPYLPFGPALGARQINMQRLLCVQAGQVNQGKAPALLWATREALQCADVAAVLAWLPDARSAFAPPADCRPCAPQAAVCVQAVAGAARVIAGAAAPAAGRHAERGWQSFR